MGRSVAPVGGLPKMSDEDDFPPPDDGVERLDGFMPAVVVLVVGVELDEDDLEAIDADDPSLDEADLSFDSDFCFC